MPRRPGPHPPPRAHRRPETSRKRRPPHHAAKPRREIPLREPPRATPYRLRRQQAPDIRTDHERAERCRALARRRRLLRIPRRPIKNRAHRREETQRIRLPPMLRHRFSPPPQTATLNTPSGDPTRPFHPQRPQALPIHHIHPPRDGMFDDPEAKRTILFRDQTACINILGTLPPRRTLPRETPRSR